MKTVNKPWGKEIWLELNDKYCYKRIHINKGYKTSFQYHEKKVETNYIIDGKAEVWLENDHGTIEKTVMTSGEHFTVMPPRKHRVIALTDLILQEVSTPEVDDVIRIQDDTNRDNGRIRTEHLQPALCILAAGKGLRLGNLTKYINKGLLPVDNKAVISHIIEKTPDNYEVVIALGYKGDLIRQYCLAAHPERKFTFVEVGDIESEKSGPGYSLDACREYLQKPFMLSTVDCLIRGSAPPMDGNWIAVHPTGIPELYSTVSFDKNNNVVSVMNKDVDGHNHSIIGLFSILEYEAFWKELDKDLHTGEVIGAFYNVGAYKQLSAKKVDWHDTGTIDDYMKAQREYETAERCGILKINGELSYKVGGRFIKIFPDKGVTQNRIKRAKNLQHLVPPISSSSENCYSYNWLPGKTLYDLDDKSAWSLFLDWCLHNLWEKETNDIHELCEKFYKEKTIKRLTQLLSQREDGFDGPCTVNGVQCKEMERYLEKIDWEYLNDGISTKLFHGDLQFDNIVYDESEFHLIDWRDSFGGSPTYGDVYYDLAKLYGGILMSYKLMKQEDKYSTIRTQNSIEIFHERTKALENFENYFIGWVRRNNFNFDKIQKITALIYLNMSPLHEERLGDLLFYKSKMMMEEIYFDK
tara:strand:- start:277 stop:2190 length:1914 start_codon:yes stop_codon:yes gene_type:complete